jgi:hypothetical protein
LAGVAFVNPSPLPADDLTQARGYYRGTPTSVNTSAAPTTSTTFTVTDTNNATTPSCSGVTPTQTCPTINAHSKVFPELGFVANYASNLPTEQGDTLFGFDTSLFTTAFDVALDGTGGGGFPVIPRVTPDGNWVYVAKQGNQKVSVFDPVAGAAARADFSVSNTGTFNPSGLDIEPQQYFLNTPGNPGICTTSPCSDMAPYVRYDAWLVDPTVNNHTLATVEPIPDAENPGMLPNTLLSANALTLVNANNIAVSADGTQAFVSLSYSPYGTACGAPPCNTLAILGLPTLSVSAPTTYPPGAPTSLSTGLRAGAVAVDTRGNYVYTTTRDNTGTYSYITISSTGALPGVIGFIPSAAGPTGTVNVCSNGGVPTALNVSPDGNRLFISCLDTTNTPQTNNTVDVWNVSQADGNLLSAHTFASAAAVGVPDQTISLPVSHDNSSALYPNAENGCETPVDIKTKLTNDLTTSAYGTRLFVSCQDSDTVVAINYNTGAGSTTLDSNDGISATVFSTDTTPIANTATAPYLNACGNTGSCPQLLDLMPNPALHFVTGGYAPATTPVPMIGEINSTPYYQYVVVAGGTVPRTWSNPDSVLSSDPNCAGLTLNSSTGQITGTAANTSVTCGGTNGFIIRVTDAAGQFVERAFTIPIHP